MKEYKLTDKQISELILLMSVNELRENFSRYAPAVRTIYRRLEEYGIHKPAEVRRDFRRDLLLAAPPFITDEEAEELVDLKIQEMIREVSDNIEDEAEAFRQRVNR